MIIDPRLREQVRLLGTMLGGVISKQVGVELFQKIELIRKSAKAARQGCTTSHHKLADTLASLQDNQVLPVARSFNQFLNLANIAEQHHRMRGSRAGEKALEEQHTCVELFDRLIANGTEPEALASAVNNVQVELTLTAHPTEVTRRTLIRKYDHIAALLREHDHQDLCLGEHADIRRCLQSTMTEIWETDEIRGQRPTPIDEAKWGFAVIENSLWHAVPSFLRRVDSALEKATGMRLPQQATPVRFSSWMGGDRDGNPHVTSAVTREVLLLARWMSADLFLRDVDQLAADLSMHRASPALKAQTTEQREPYRAVLKTLRARLLETRGWAAAALHSDVPPTPGVLTDNEQLIAPLQLCYESLHQCGMGLIADGPLLDCLRRAATFGVYLTRLDIRQEASKNAAMLS
jgi:phosphoenolpyruvate carboxylase